jgi:long-chain-alcohol oxidase
MIVSQEEAIETTLDSGERLELGLLLSALSTVVGSALLIPCPPFTVAFTNRTTTEREAALSALGESSLPPRRKAFNGLKRLILGLACSHTDPSLPATTPAHRLNPFWAAAGYPGPPHRHSAVGDATAAAAATKAAAAADAEALKQSTPEVDFAAASILITKDTTLEYDVVVVGSGAGGGVAAAALAEKGYSVLVLEKGKYFAPAETEQLEAEAMQGMYEKSGLLTTDDGSIAILAGATLGGGTSINWACCLDTPAWVREEWVNKHGTLLLKCNKEEVKFRVRECLPPSHTHTHTHTSLPLV